MLISLVIGTRNRATTTLRRCLEAVAAATEPDCAVEVIIVDNGSTDDTAAIIDAFIRTAALKMRHLYSPGPQISAARNLGIAAATGVWIVFTDDDCYLDRDYFVEFSRFTKWLLTRPAGAPPISYGGGQIHFLDKEDDTRIAARYFTDYWEIPKNSLLAAAALQGANMFFRRKVLEAIGGFNEDMGPGTPFGGEDIELACRASCAGFVGAQIPTLKVHHHHGRRQGSAEAEAILAGYDHARGVYYASLLDKGLIGAWQLWSSACALENNPDPALRRRLAREFEGAAQYLNFLLEKREDSSPAPSRQVG